MEHYEDCRKIVLKVASIWIHSIPEKSIFSKDDLVQECWATYPKAIANFDESYGVKFTTYFYRGCYNTCKAIVYRERMIQNYVADMDDIEENCPDESKKPDSLYELCEMLDYITDESNIEFMKMIVNGVPKELFKLIKLRDRYDSYKRGRETINHKFHVPKKVLEYFYDVDLDVLKEKYYNYNKN